MSEVRILPGELQYYNTRALKDEQSNKDNYGKIKTENVPANGAS